MKHTTKAFIIYYHSKYSDEPTFLLMNRALKGDGFATVREQEFEFEVPDDFNPVAEMVAELHEKKRELRLALAKQLAEIDQRIGKLTCLTNDVTEAA